MPIRETFDQRRPLACAGFFKRGLRGPVNDIGVVTVDQDALEPVCGSTIGCRLRNRSHVADGRVFHIEIVFADEYHRKFPHRGEIERFMERTDIRRAVAEEADRDVLVAFVLRAPRSTARDGKMRTDDGI